MMKAKAVYLFVLRKNGITIAQNKNGIEENWEQKHVKKLIRFCSDQEIISYQK